MRRAWTQAFSTGMKPLGNDEFYVLYGAVRKQQRDAAGRCADARMAEARAAGEGVGGRGGAVPGKRAGRWLSWWRGEEREELGAGVRGLTRAGGACVDS